MSAESPTARIYLDNAATSWPKPESVYTAVDRYLRECGAAAGRGGYSSAHQASSIVDQARRKVAELIGAPAAEQIFFTCSGTDSLNTALHGLLEPGDHVVTTAAEHNSTLRPLFSLKAQGTIELNVVGCDSQGFIEPAEFNAAIRPNTKLISIVHASNVTGAVQPIDEIGKLAHHRGILVLVDAAQTLGHLPIDVSSQPIDLLAAPGHKGILGPLGTGLLFATSDAASRMRPLRQGGTGTLSHETTQPDAWPERFESGNLNVPGIAGLAAGVEFLKTNGLTLIRERQQAWTQKLVAGLDKIPSIQCVGHTAQRPHVPVISLILDGRDPREISLILDQAFQIQTRAGFHCAPLIHRSIGSDKTGGTLRLSPGVFSESHDPQQIVSAIAEVMEA